MKPQYQLTHNDCMRACIASLLDHRIERVPNFVEAGTDPAENGLPKWWMSMQSWLNDFGLAYIEVTLAANVPWHALPYPSLCLLLGTTEKGVRHAVIGRAEHDRFSMVFNPFPRGGGIASVEGLGFLVPRDPMSYIRMGAKLTSILRLSDNSGITPVSNIRMTEIHQLAKEALQQEIEGYNLPINGQAQKGP